MNSNNSSFDGIAYDYCSSIKPIPIEYCNLIKETFKLTPGKKVLELGCGNGELSIAISKSKCSALGIDISSEMIDIANNNSRKNLEFKCLDVFDYDFKKEQYDLIISYESIHLFQPLMPLLEKCFYALKPGGCVCMGWCEYNWEIPLKEIIINTFESNGVLWGSWGFSKHLPFFDICRQINKNGIIKLKSINIFEEWTAKQITNYLLSISKSKSLTNFQHDKIYNDLLKEIESKGPSFYGSTKYCIAFMEKQ